MDVGAVGGDRAFPDVLCQGTVGGVRVVCGGVRGNRDVRSRNLCRSEELGTGGGPRCREQSSGSAFFPSKREHGGRLCTPRSDGCRRTGTASAAAARFEQSAEQGSLRVSGYGRSTLGESSSCLLQERTSILEK